MLGSKLKCTVTQTLQHSNSVWLQTWFWFLTLLTIAVLAPSLAACMHWLAPFPPKPMKNLWPWMVSPALGNLGAWLREKQNKTKKTANEHNFKEYKFIFQRTSLDLGDKKLRFLSLKECFAWIFNLYLLFPSQQSLHTADWSFENFHQTLQMLYLPLCSTLKTRSKGRCQNVKTESFHG